MRIVFAGTPPFSVTPLQHLINADHELICVYTQPDRKTGRGQKLIPPAVKVCAQEHGIEVRQPTSLKSVDEIQKLKEFKPDIMIVVAYGMILPQEILDIPKYGCLNIHASLLPKWRGAAPIQRAIEAGDAETGICIMQMDAGLDTGDVLMQEKIKIEKDDSTVSMHNKLSALGADALIKTINLIEANEETATQQNHSESSYAKKITKNEANIDWALSSIEIDCRIRAFNPWPVCQTTLNDKRIRIWDSENLENTEANNISAENVLPGTIIDIDSNGITVACGKNAILIKKLQLDGSKALDHQQFVNGHAIEIGNQFVSQS